MGDIADYTLDQVIDEWSGAHDDFGDEESFVLPGKQCRYCNREGLYWARANGEWRLFDGDEMHVCPVNPLRDGGGR